jgi:hypothetical protein
MRQDDVRVVAAPAVPIRPAQAGRLDPNHHAIRGTGGIANVSDDGRRPEVRIYHGAHVETLVAADFARCAALRLSA